MFCSKKIVAAIGFSVVSLASYSQDQLRAPPSVADQTKEIIRVVNLYAEAIACLPDENLSGRDIAAMSPLKDMDLREEAKFAVVWRGDIGCAGGSGTTGAHLAVVKVGAGDSFYVDAYESEPTVDAGLPRAIEKIVGATKDSLILDVLDYGDKDANCCPSLRTRITLKQLQNGKWQKVATKKMPPVKY